MKRTIVVVIGLFILLALALSPSQPALLAARSAQSATPTPAAEAEPTAAPAVEGAADAAEPTMAEFLARLESLEATVAELQKAARVTSNAQINDINTAIYLLDSAGLHGIDVRLNEEKTIQPGDAGLVGRVARLLTTVDWPASLAVDAADLRSTLGALAGAMNEDNLEAAAPLATQAHEEQHDFSHHAEEWLAEAVVVETADAAEGANGINTAIYLLDSAGLHEVDVRLNEEKTIQPGDSGQVDHVARLLTTVAWPEELAEEAALLQETLTALSAALEEDDLEAAAPLATQAHEEQHDFSHNAQAWLAETGEAADQANRVNTAIYLLDGVDLHDLAERLVDEKAIQPGDGGQVARLARLLATVDWPDALDEDAGALHETLSALAAALIGNDLAAATPLADQAHEEQHDFSHTAQEWLAAGQAEAEQHE